METFHISLVKVPGSSGSTIALILRGLMYPLLTPDGGSSCLGKILTFSLSRSTENAMQKVSVKLEEELSDHLSGHRVCL